MVLVQDFAALRVVKVWRSVAEFQAFAVKFTTVDTVRDFLIELDMKPNMHLKLHFSEVTSFKISTLEEISIFSLNNQTTKIMNRAGKN